MTAAICTKCGEFKFGAWTTCSKCGAIPQTDDEAALALAMTDHYFDRATLTKMGQAIKNGHASPVPPEMRETLLGELKANHFSMPSLLRQLAARRRATVVKKKPRWKFW